MTKLRIVKRDAEQKFPSQTTLDAVSSHEEFENKLKHGINELLELGMAPSSTQALAKYLNFDGCKSITDEDIHCYKKVMENINPFHSKGGILNYWDKIKSIMKKIG